MYFLYDNLTALIIATTVIFIVLSMQIQATQMSNQEVAINASKNQAHALATWLERDLSRIGANMDTDESPLSKNSNGSCQEFEFRYRDAGNQEEITVEYTTEESETGEDCQLVREVDAAPEGRFPALDYFHVDMLNGAAEPTSDEEKYQSVRVQFAVAAPAGETLDLPLIEEAIHRKITVPYPPAQLD